MTLGTSQEININRGAWSLFSTHKNLFLLALGGRPQQPLLLPCSSISSLKARVSVFFKNKKKLLVVDWCLRCETLESTHYCALCASRKGSKISKASSVRNLQELQKGLSKTLNSSYNQVKDLGLIACQYKFDLYNCFRCYTIVYACITHQWYQSHFTMIITLVDLKFVKLFYGFVADRNNSDGMVTLSAVV